MELAFAIRSTGEKIAGSRNVSMIAIVMEFANRVFANVSKALLERIARNGTSLTGNSKTDLLSVIRDGKGSNVTINNA